MYNKLLVTLLLLSGFAASFSLNACQQTPYKVGVQAIDYTPHYNGQHTDEKSFFKVFLQWLSSKTGCKFDIVNLPIKRLELEFNSLSLDFIYPDNPNWHTNPSNRHYSPSLAIALGGTMVKPANANIDLASFHVLVFPRGFSPVAWHPLQKKYAIDFKEVSDPKAALLMVEAERATGADIEYNVAQHIATEHKLTPLVVAKNLPFTPTGFHLTTIKHQKFMGAISQLVNEHSAEIAKMRKKAGLIESLPNTIN